VQSLFTSQNGIPMTARKLTRLGTTLVVPALVVGAFTAVGHTVGHSTAGASSAVRLDHDSTELAASGDVWYQAHWDTDAGSQGYMHLVNTLRNIIDVHGGHRTNVRDGSRNYAVDTTPANANRAFVDVEMTTSGATVHLMLRLSDMYVIGYHYNQSGRSNVYMPLLRGADAPDPNETTLGSPHNSVGTWGYFQGNESYAALAGMAGPGVTAQNLAISEHNLQQAVWDLRGDPQDTRLNTRRAQALMRVIGAVSEGTRFRPLATDLSRAMDRGGQITLGNYLDLIHNWQNLSETYAGTGRTVRTSSHGTISTVQQAAALLMVALAHHSTASQFPDEL